MSGSPEYFIFILYLADLCSAKFTLTALFLEGLSRGCSLKLVILSAASEIGMGCLTASKNENLPSQQYKNKNCVCT